MVVKHHRLNRDIRLARPHSLVAQERSTVEEAYPGDIIGIINPGVFGIGDTVSLTGGFNFKPLPQFQPEIFARLRPTDVGKRKAFDKGLSQMAQEGTVQIMRSLNDQEALVAAVGRLSSMCCNIDCATNTVWKPSWMRYPLLQCLAGRRPSHVRPWPDDGEGPTGSSRRPLRRSAP